LLLLLNNRKTGFPKIRIAVGMKVLADIVYPFEWRIIADFIYMHKNYA